VFAFSVFSFGQAKLTAKDYIKIGWEKWDTVGLDEAIASFTKATELDPMLAEAYWARGFVYDSSGESEKAMAEYDKVVEMYPSNPEAWCERGYSYSGRNEDEDAVKAIKDFTHALKLKPDYIDALTDRADTYDRMGKHTLAMADRTTVVRLRPRDAVGYEARADSYSSISNCSLAIADYTTALKLRAAKDYKYTGVRWPNSLYYYRGKCEAYLKKYDAALADYEMALKLAPDEKKFTTGTEPHTIYLTRARLYCRTGKKDLAATDEQKYIDLGHPLDDQYRCKAK
jgi:tetratricopeptide (TPR) repeat protein